MPIQANVTNNQITANVGETQIDVSVSGGVGPSGTPGSAATVTVGTVTTGSPGSSASVVNAGTNAAAVLNFTIPAGAAGSTGAQGPQGPAGSTGPQGPQGPAGTTTWAGITDKPSTFTPSSHTHGNITSDGKMSVNGISGNVLIIGEDGYIRANDTLDASVVHIDGLSEVAYSGSYDHLFDKPTIPSAYTLPTASSTVLGGVKIGSGVTITNGVISVSTAYAATSHAHGNLTNAGAIGTTSGLIVVTTTGGALTTAATISTSQISGLGTLATQSGTFSGTSSGTNTGDQIISLTGDVTGSGTGSFAATLATSGVTAGSYGSASSVATYTVDAKGRLTAAGSTAIAISAGAVSGLAASATTDTTNAANISSGTITAARLPAATTSTLGGVIVGAGLAVDGSGNLTVNERLLTSLSSSTINSTTETSVASVSLTAAANDVIRGRFWGTFNNNSGSSNNITFRIKLGSTTVLTMVSTFTTFTTARNFVVDFVIGVPSTTSQVAVATATLAPTTGTGLQAVCGTGTATETVSSAKTLDMTAQMSVGSGSPSNPSIVFLGAIVERSKG